MGSVLSSCGRQGQQGGQRPRLEENCSRDSETALAMNLNLDPNANANANDEQAQGQGVGITCSDKLKIFYIGTDDSEAVKKFLECPICLNICVPPIFQCETGHHICENCKDLLTQCPTCSAKFHGTRNFFLEKYFEQNYRFLCPNGGCGCKELLTGYDLKENNEGECCTAASCPLCKYQNPKIANFVPFSDYLIHLYENHKSHYSFCRLSGQITFGLLWSDVLTHISRIPMPDGDLPYSLWGPQVLKFGGFKFAVLNFLQKFELTFFVMILGNENEANQFYVQFTIKTKTKTKGGKMPKKIAQLIGSVIPINSSEPNPIKEKKSKLIYNINLLSVCQNLKPETKFKITCKLAKKK